VNAVPEETEKIMSCPRCEHTGIEQVAASPVEGVWTVHQCERCLHTWRSTEPARRTSPEHYPPEFRMTRADIDAAPPVPAVPPLVRR
jgi:hypothetical protein